VEGAGAPGSKIVITKETIDEMIDAATDALWQDPNSLFIEFSPGTFRSIAETVILSVVSILQRGNV
jgi:hypothetical protein